MGEIVPSGSLSMTSITGWSDASAAGRLREKRKADPASAPVFRKLRRCMAPSTRVRVNTGHIRKHLLAAVNTARWRALLVIWRKEYARRARLHSPTFNESGFNRSGDDSS